MEKSKVPKSDTNQKEFKIYFVMSAEIGKLNEEKFSSDNPEYKYYVCEKTFPSKNNKYQVYIFSLTYNKNKTKQNDEISILYDKCNSSDKYKLNVNDNYLFNIKFQLTGICKKYWKFPAQVKISEKTQFNYYLDFLREKKLSATYTKLI